jgi:hypothetical protein
MVLENIARKGNEEQREWATRALSQDHSIRLARVQNSLAAIVTSRQRADALVGDGEETSPTRRSRWSGATCSSARGFKSPP